MEKEVSLIVLKNSIVRFKVTLRVPDMMISETKMFRSKVDAEKQFQAWLE